MPAKKSPFGNGKPGKVKITNLKDLTRDVIRVRKPRKPNKCPKCKKVRDDLEWGPDPYASDIYGDSTPEWQCSDCNWESSQSI